MNSQFEFVRSSARGWDRRARSPVRASAARCRTSWLYRRRCGTSTPRSMGRRSRSAPLYGSSSRSTLRRGGVIDPGPVPRSSRASSRGARAGAELDPASTSLTTDGTTHPGTPQPSSAGMPVVTRARASSGPGGRGSAKKRSRVNLGAHTGVRRCPPLRRRRFDVTAGFSVTTVFTCAAGRPLRRKAVSRHCQFACLRIVVRERMARVTQYHRATATIAAARPRPRTLNRAKFALDSS